MIVIQIKTDNIELNVSSDSKNISASEFLESMKKVIDMAVEAENDLAYNTEVELQDAANERINSRIKSTINEAGSELVRTEGNNLGGPVNVSFLDILNTYNAANSFRNPAKKEQIEAIIEKWNRSVNACK
jgi:hypothetical protein